MLNADELDPQRARQKPTDLQQMSVEELHVHIGHLQDEIARAEAMIAQKERHRTGVDALFGAARPPES